MRVCVLTRVYFLLDAEAAQIKIGFTKNLSQRIANLSLGRGRPLDLLGTLRGGRRLERALHARFRPYRRWGREWYSTEIIAEVQQLLLDEPG